MNMADGNHHPGSDEEFVPIKLRALRQERSSKCLVYVLVVIVSLTAFLLVLASIFLRANTPNVKLSSVTVKSIRHGSKATSPSFNVTLVTELTIENKNFGYFKFMNETGSFSYGGVKIHGGGVEARETKKMNVTVEARSNGYLDSKNLSSDINSGMLKLNSYAKLHGRVNLLDILWKTMTPELNCSLTLVLRSQAIRDLVCS